MENKIFLENGITHEFTADEMKLLRLLVSEHAKETADKYNISVEAVKTLKVVFFDHLDIT